MAVLAAFTAALTITVWPAGPGGERRTRHVSCPGAAVCARLEAAGRRAFRPVPRDMACTALYGGPQVAIVAGTLDGRRVWARFRRTDGCQIARWDRVAFLFRK